MMPSNFIVVDDDPLNNKICQLLIKSVIKESEIKTFTVPEIALEFVANDFQNSSANTVLLLDINMPTMSGWEFLDEFKKLNVEITNKFKIFILSSSVDENDISRAKNDAYVVDFISKPLSSNILKAAVQKVLPVN